MNYKEAEKLSRYVVSADALLHQILIDLQENLPRNEFENLAKKIGTISGEIIVSILRPLWDEHETLKSKAAGGAVEYDLESLLKLGRLVSELPIVKVGSDR